MSSQAVNSASTPLLDCFWQLAEVSADTRLHAAKSLLRQLLEAQTEFEALASKQGHSILLKSDRPCCNDLAYAVTRLCRGVASSNKGARQGFALALTHVLQTFPNVKSLDVVTQVYKAAQFSRRSSGDEQRDGMLGRVFGILALQRAGRIPSLAGITISTKQFDPAFRGIEALLAQKSAAKEDGAEDIAEGKEEERSTERVLTRTILSFLVEDFLCLATKKAWITDLAYEAIAAVVISAGPEVWRTELQELVTQHLQSDPSRWNPEQLSLALALEDALVQWFGDSPLELPPFVSSLQAAFNTDTLLRYRFHADDEEEEELNLAARVEAAATAAHAEKASDDEDDEVSNSGSDNDEDAKMLPVATAPLANALLASTHSYPQLHSVWGHLFQRFYKNALSSWSGKSVEAPSHAVVQFTETWRVYVDELLMPHGPERKATAIALAVSLFPVAAAAHPAVLSGILSPHLIRTVAQSMASKKRVLHTPAQEFARSLLKACHGNSAASSVALFALLVRGHPDFDRKTRSQTVATLLNELDDDALMQHIAAAQREFARPTAAPVFADIATSVTGVSFADKPEAKDEDEDEEERLKPSQLSPVDARRLWALDTIVSAVKTARFARQGAAVKNIVSYLAFHAFADIQLPEGFAERLLSGKLDSTLASITSGAEDGGKSVTKSSKKRSRTDAEDRTILATLSSIQQHVQLAQHGDNVSSLDIAVLCADPPVSDVMRGQLKGRMLSLLRLLNASNKVEDSDRQVSVMRTTIQHAEAIQAVWQLLCGVAASVSGGSETSEFSVSVQPSTEELSRVHSHDDDEEDDDEDDEDEGDAKEEVEEEDVPIAAVLSQSANAIRKLVAAAQADVNAPVAKRACLSYAQLLSCTSLHILLENDAGVREEAGAALRDFVLASISLLREHLTALDSHTSSSTTNTTSSASATASAKKKRADKGLFASYVTTVLGEGESSNGDDISKDIAVFTDASLSLMANGPLLLRECVKSVGKYVYVHGTAECVESILEVVLEKTKADDDGDGDDKMNGKHGKHGDDEDDDDDDEDEENDESEEDDAPIRKQKPSDKDDANDDDEGSDDDDDDDDEESSDDEAVVAGVDAEMDKYDGMLAAMITARKQQRNAASSARQRAVQFKFRALDLLDIALQGMSGVAVSKDSSNKRGAASSELLHCFTALLEAVRSLANWSKSKSATTAAQTTAADSASLLQRLQAILQGVSKARFIAAEGGKEEDEQQQLADSVLAVFDAVIATVLEDPNPPLLDSAAGVVTVLLRALRNPSPALNNNPQPHARHVAHLASGYAEVLTRYLTEKHSRLSPVFIKHVLTTVPVLSVRFIQPITAAIASDAPMKPFKLVECITYLQSIVKAATAAWVKGVACGVEGADEISVSDYLTYIAPQVASSMARIIEHSLAAPSTDAATTRVIKFKALPQVFSLISQLARAQLLRNTPETTALMAAMEHSITLDSASKLHDRIQSCLGEVRKSVASHGSAAKPKEKRSREEISASSTAKSAAATGATTATTTTTTTSAATPGGKAKRPRKAE